MEIEGKVGLVTGRADGVSKAFAEALLQKGAKGVVLVDDNEAAAQATKENFEKAYGSGKVLYCKCDVTNGEQVKAAYAEAKAKFGQIDIVCNNATVWDEADWANMMLVNINGTVHSTKEALEHLSRGGVIVNVSSVAALSLLPFGALFAASKCAVLGYTKNLATFDPHVKENNIRINTLCPCAVRSNLQGLARPDEQHRERFMQMMKNLKLIEPSQVAESFVRLITEPHQGQTLYIHPIEGEQFMKDEAEDFRKRIMRSREGEILNV
ncbi:15-hydroxyprostaglandin dehydrogenase [NAD(+)]-like [Amphiura filiformis]|uniref:15-hydroxyprostaglandin dehydrogenase [NAD(+)]-like n=1 Tax=Amphiura filiformis TaxID=82378 RepID=UPI003B21C071